MTTRIGTIALVLGALAMPAPLRAEGGRHIAVEPAATLLLPYFEVALPKKPNGKQKGVNTLFTINNAEAFAVLAHVTIWSDLSVPVFIFDVYLTGYDAITIDLFEVIHGRLPQTASVGQDQGQEEISPQGPISQDINFASCNGDAGLPPAALPAGSVEHLRASLTGQPSPLFGDLCLGRDYEEKKPIARGFVTIDTVNSCSLLFPDQPGYLGITTTDQNNLFGEWYMTDKKSVYGDNLVAVRADATEFVAGDYTFYSRFVADTATDHRQPLATNFTGRFANDPKDPLFPGGTEVIVWRDVKKPQGAFNCSTTPTFFPLLQEQIVAFDDEEQVEGLEIPAVPPLPPGVIVPFPGAAQRAAVGSPDLPVTFPRGFLRLNLNTILVDQTTNAGDPAAAQNSVTMVHSTRKHRMALRATALDDANNARHEILPVD
jgi:hypothetical protein